MLLHRGDRPVEGDPHHHPGVREPPQRTADLPQPVVRLVPVPGQLLDQRALQRPGVLALVETEVAGHLQRHHHLAEHVGLPLGDRAVADPHGGRAGVPGQVVERPLGQVAAAVHGVHDLQVLRVAGDRAQQPAAPQPGLVVVAGLQQRLEGQRRVAQPAVPVVPVALAAELLRQRGGGRRDDAAGAAVGEQTQGEQGAHDRLAVRPGVAAHAGPRLGDGDRLVDPVLVGQRLRQLVVRGRPGGREGQLLTGLERELVGVLAVHRPRQPGAAQDQPVRAGDGRDHLDAVGVLAPHPGPHLAVAEPDHPLVPDHHLALDPDDPAHDVGAAVAERHHVEHDHAAGVGRPRGLQDGAVPDVPAAAGRRLVLRPRAASARAPGRPAGAAKQAWESKRGRHSQSTEPSLPTSAAVPVSPSTA